MRLFRAAQPLAGRLRGLVRVGERRWDVVLDRDQRILLPENAPVQALERVIALSEAQDILERDLAAVDMRISARPTLRMNKAAVSEWWRIRQLSNDGLSQ
jgi:cell division protein FtsQ